MKSLPETDSIILHNPRLPSYDDHFEIDSLLLSPRYFLLMEAKNWYGTLYFDAEKQVIRVGDDGREEGLPNPILQVKLQQHRFRKWLHSHDSPPIPILYFVVISFPSTIVKPLYSHTPIPHEVTNSRNLLFNIQELNRMYSELVVNHKTLEQVSDSIVSDHTPRLVNVLQKFSIDKSELLTGIPCPTCAAFPMIKQHSKWLCSNCQYTVKDAHLSALYDYKLLISDHISNGEARSFLHIDSPYAAKRLLQKGEFPAIGDKKTRKYILDFGNRR